MQWDESNPVVDEVTYGDLMMMANFNKRWVYKGSVTTPPCLTNVYWNVLSTIYPIKQEHVDAFKSRLDAATPGLAEQGNFRLVQPIDGQDVIYVTEDPGMEDWGMWDDDKWDPCACLGYDALPTDFFEEEGYGAWYGSSCTNWDAEKDYCQEGGDSVGEDWCDPEYSWCYVDPMCYDSEPTLYFDDTPYEDMLNWRVCDDDVKAAALGNLVATMATTYAVLSLTM